MSDEDGAASLILKNAQPCGCTYSPAKVHRVVSLAGHLKRRCGGHALPCEDAGRIGKRVSGGAEKSMAETRVIAPSPGRGDGYEHGMPIAVFR